MMVPSDAELVASARAGDPAGLGALIQRHHASMLAVALAVLGHRPEAEDAVQDAAVTALARLSELRDPSAAGAWLRAIVRNNCAMILRRQRPAAALDELAAAAANPEELLERHALQGWTLRALDALSEPLQLTLLLRYFTGLTAYEDIAAFSCVPIGTVRSRLAEGKRKLTEALLAAACGLYDDVSERSRRSACQAAQVIAEAEAGRFSRAAGEIFEPELSIVGPTPAWGTDLPFLLHAMDSDCAHGVRHVLRNVIAGSRVTIWEMDLLSPASDPDHCPPSILWAHFAPAGRTRRLRLFHAAR
jgi:RNA polymerase sigma factor (sigma-70 family)